MRKQMWKSAVAVIAAAGLMASPVLAKDAFETYNEAYTKTMANMGFDADIEASFTMDGATKTAEGNFKLDDSGDATQFILEVSVDGETITQFTDGEYLYTDARGEKSKYPLGQKQDQEDSRKEPEGKNGEEEGSAPSFTSDDFLKEMASSLESGKIREMGLLSALEKNYVTETNQDGDTYSMVLKDIVIDKIEDVLSSTVTVDGDSVTISDLDNVTYDAVIEDGYVSSITYGGTMTVTVPAAVSGTDSEESYDLDMSIKVSFNDPGSQISVELPSTEGF